MTLYIDSREPVTVQAIVQTTLADRDTDAETEVKELKTGDFVYKNVVIERKEASDLASSIKDRRLKEQTRRMTEDFEHQYIIVEGDPYDLQYSNLHDNSFIGTLVSRSHAGISIVYTPDEEGTAYAVNKIVSKHEDDEEHRTIELGETTVSDVDTEVAMLMQIDGVSKKKAERILDQREFGKLERLCEIRGIGEVLEDRIKSVL
jgi:DNA excision repair protein ERCC-4